MPYLQTKVIASSCLCIVKNLFRPTIKLIPKMFLPNQSFSKRFYPIKLIPKMFGIEMIVSNRITSKWIEPIERIQHNIYFEMILIQWNGVRGTWLCNDFCRTKLCQQKDQCWCTSYAKLASTKRSSNSFRSSSVAFACYNIMKKKRQTYNSTTETRQGRRYKNND